MTFLSCRLAVVKSLNLECKEFFFESLPHSITSRFWCLSFKSPGALVNPISRGSSLRVNFQSGLRNIMILFYIEPFVQYQKGVRLHPCSPISGSRLFTTRFHRTLPPIIVFSYEGLYVSSVLDLFSCFSSRTSCLLRAYFNSRPGGIVEITFSIHE